MKRNLTILIKAGPSETHEPERQEWNHMHTAEHKDREYTPSHWNKTPHTSPAPESRGKVPTKLVSTANPMYNLCTQPRRRSHIIGGDQGKGI